MRYLTPAQMNTKMVAIQAANPTLVRVHTFPNNTSEGREMKYLELGDTTIPNRVPVLLVGGVHAREWAPPDSLLKLAEKLVDSYRTSSPFKDSRFVWTSSDADAANDPGYIGGIVFDRQIFSLPDVQKIIRRIKLFIVPCSNPDGRAHSMNPNPNPIPTPLRTNAAYFSDTRFWRKNRSTPAIGACTTVGADLNRNFPFAWEAETYYNFQGSLNAQRSTSVIPCDGARRADTYRGTSAGSEIEIQNLISLINGEQIKFYLDFHQHKRSVYIPWSVNSSQVTDPGNSALNSVLDQNVLTGIGGRDLNNTNDGNLYREWFPHSPIPNANAFDLFDSHKKIADTMRNGIQNSAGADAHARRRAAYSALQSLQPGTTRYPVTGGASDYVLSRQMDQNVVGAPTLNSRFPIHSFLIEAGHISDGGFWPIPDPNRNQFRKVQREIHAASLDLLRVIANQNP